MLKADMKDKLPKPGSQSGGGKGNDNKPKGKGDGKKTNKDNKGKGGDKDKSKRNGKGKKGDKFLFCRFFLSPEGCKKGASCDMPHLSQEQVDTIRKQMNNGQ